MTPAAVTPVGPFTWTGANGSAWDINATANWSNASGASKYVDGYAVTFDDTAGAGHGTVSIAGTVEPTSILVNNSSLAYTFSGAGSIADNIAGPTSLTKSGNGSLEINMAGNTYSGGTFLTAGVLQVDASSTVTSGTLASGPLGVGPINLSGGTLQDNGSGGDAGQRGEHHRQRPTLAGLTFGPQGLSTPNTVTITGAPTITVTSPVTIADQVSGNLVKAGSSTLTLTAAANNLAGTTQVSGGTLVGTAANIATPVALSNSANVTYNQAVPGTLSQVVSGNGSLTAAGIAVLAVTSSNTYTGATTINSGAPCRSAAAAPPARSTAPAA